jgi:hypothetical protein
MKFSAIFALVLICALVASSDGNKRQKRTLGTILQFFGYRIVPLRGNGNSVEKIQNPPPTVNRIQTVIPTEAAPSMAPETTSPPSTESPAMTTTMLPSTTAAPATEQSVNMRIIVMDPTTSSPDSGMSEEFSQFMEAPSSPSLPQMESATEAARFSSSEEFERFASSFRSPSESRPEQDLSTSQSFEAKQSSDSEGQNKFDFYQSNPRESYNYYQQPPPSQPSYYYEPRAPFASNNFLPHHDQSTNYENQQYFSYLTHH